MSEHKKTLVIFFKNTVTNLIEAIDHCKDSIKSIASGLFGLFMVLLSIFAWIIGFAILLFLPLATWLRLYIERKTKESIEKQRLEIFKRSGLESYEDE